MVLVCTLLSRDYDPDNNNYCHFDKCLRNLGLYSKAQVPHEVQDTTWAEYANGCQKLSEGLFGQL